MLGVVDRKTVVIVVIVDIVTNIVLITLMAIGYLLNAAVELMIGLDCQAAFSRLKRFVQGICSSC